MDEQMQDSLEPVGWLIEFKNNIGETITRFYTHNAIGDYRASVDANATSTPLYKLAALSQPAAQGDSSHSAGGECGGVQVPRQTLVEWALSATPEQLERGDWRIVCAGLRQAKERFAEARLGNQSWLDCYIQIAESRGKEPGAGDRVQVPLTDSQAYAISAPIFSGGNRHPRAELELVRAIEAAHGIKATQ